MSRPLRVAALVKQIPQIESMALGPDGRLLRDGVPLQMNDYCRRAVTQGHELARASGGTLTVLTLGPPSAENVLREALAYGADAGVHITDPAFAGSDTLATARALAAALNRAGPFDLVLMGRNSVDADTGQVPPQIATLLDLPFAAGVRELHLDGEVLRLQLEHDDEWVEAEVELPALLSCAERLCSPCKVKDPAAWAAVDPSRIRRLAAADLGPGPWGAAGSPTQVGDVHPVVLSRDRQVVADGPVTEQVAAVLAVLDSRDLPAGQEDRDAAQVPGEELPPAGSVSGPAVVVAVEPDRSQLTRELLGSAASLAAQIDGRVVAFGPAPADPTVLSTWGADELVTLDGSDAEQDIASALADWCRATPPWAVLGPGTAWGRDVLSRAAVTLQAGLTGDATALHAFDGRLVASKPAFGGQLIAEIHCSSPIQLATVRAGVLGRPGPRPASVIPTTNLTLVAASRLRVRNRRREDDTDDLTTADLVIGVGAGVSPEDYPLLRSFADQLGAALCATRKVTDNGSMPRARQVGITGHTIAPALFISLGSSGKFNHTVGVRAAGTVVAVNIDPTAPIFGFADVGIVGDWKAVLSEFVRQRQPDPVSRA